MIIIIAVVNLLLINIKVMLQSILIHFVHFSISSILYLITAGSLWAL